MTQGSRVGGNEEGITTKMPTQARLLDCDEAYLDYQAETMQF